MSSKPNHINIHLGNYEEFLILYMDNELSEDQRLAVENFLSQHPDLRGELELLMTTKLPVEELRMDKEELMAAHMKMTAVDEELLLFIDNELTDDRKKIVELELAANTDYRLQWDALKKTKLDANEIIAFPIKQVLYRRTEKVAIITMWVRVAAVIVVMAGFSLFYFNRNASTGPMMTAGNKPAVHKPLGAIVPLNDQEPATEVAAKSVDPKKIVNKDEQLLQHKNKKNKTMQQQVNAAAENELAIVRPPVNVPERKPVDPIAARLMTGSLIASLVDQNTDKQTVNKSIVTSADNPPLNNKGLLPKPGDGDGSVASNERKGSVKGFLRKASRLIEKRTGIDPVNDNGELLIGAVALKLR